VPIFTELYLLYSAYLIYIIFAISLDLMSKCFKYIPDERITATDALQHPYIKRGRWLPTFPNLLKMTQNAEDFSFETEKHTIDILRQHLVSESMHYESITIVPPLPDNGKVIDDITDNVSSDGNVDDGLNEENPGSVSSEKEECKEPETIVKSVPRSSSKIVNPHAYVTKSPPGNNRTCNIM